jgi:hypothetical protein
MKKALTDERFLSLEKSVKDLALDLEKLNGFERYGLAVFIESKHTVAEALRDLIEHCRIVKTVMHSGDHGTAAGWKYTDKQEWERIQASAVAGKSRMLGFSGASAQGNFKAAHILSPNENVCHELYSFINEYDGETSRTANASHSPFITGSDYERGAPQHKIDMAKIFCNLVATHTRFKLYITGAQSVTAFIPLLDFDSLLAFVSEVRKHVENNNNDLIGKLKKNVQYPKPPRMYRNFQTDSDQTDSCQTDSCHMLGYQFLHKAMTLADKHGNKSAREKLRSIVRKNEFYLCTVSGSKTNITTRVKIARFDEVLLHALFDMRNVLYTRGSKSSGFLNFLQECRRRGSEREQRIIDALLEKPCLATVEDFISHVWMDETKKRRLFNESTRIILTNLMRREMKHTPEQELVLHEIGREFRISAEAVAKQRLKQDSNKMNKSDKLGKRLREVELATNNSETLAELVSGVLSEHILITGKHLDYPFADKILAAFGGLTTEMTDDMRSVILVSMLSTPPREEEPPAEDRSTQEPLP